MSKLKHKPGTKPSAGTTTPMHKPAPDLSGAGTTVQAASYKAASGTSQELACWNPRLMSADRKMLPDKGRAEARAHDLVRNNGYARGAVQNQKDRLVGDGYRLNLQPVYKLLGIEADVAAKWASSVEVAFHAWADDPDCWIDVQRKRSFTQFLRECAASELIQGEFFLVRQWKTSPVGFSTCFTSVEPERVSTPAQTLGFMTNTGETVLPNGNRIRAGCELLRDGEAVAYHIRRAHENDVGNFGMTSAAGEWDRVTKLNEFGWRQVIHIFEADSPDQTRGFSAFASTLQKMKMMDIQEDLELQLSQLSTAFAMYIKTPGGRARAQDIMGSDSSAEQFAEFMSTCMQMQEAHYGDAGVNINGVKLPVLAPDDDIGVVGSHNQPSNHEQFKDGLNRQNARGLGMSVEEYTGDFTKNSFSGMKGVMSMSWQLVKAKREATINKLATLIFRLWFDEAIVRGAIQPPPGVDYWPSNDPVMGQRFAWLTKASWIGAGKLVIDEYKQAKANETALGTHQATLSDVLAESGTDIETHLDTNVRERQMFIERGLPLPEHLGGQPRGTVTPDPMAAEQDGQAA